MSRHLFVVIALAALAGACSSRSAAATQSTPKAFDPAASDAKAIALADQVLAAAGGEQAWRKAKEIHWFQIISVDGEARDVVAHSWDRWNGRHRYSRVDASLSRNTAMYDVYERTGTAYDGQGQELTRPDELALMDEGTKRLWTDSYFLVLPFKLKDPGVHLKYKEERGEEGSTEAKWDVIRVTFDKGVGPASEDIYELSINKQTHLIDVIDRVKVEGGEEKFIGYKVEGWTDAGGIKVPTRLVNLGFKDSATVPLKVPSPDRWAEKVKMGDLPAIPELPVPNPGEAILFLKVQVDDEPDDEKYIPRVTGG